MEVYIDFLSYKSGVYSKRENAPKFSGYRTIKIFVWSVEDRTK